MEVDPQYQQGPDSLRGIYVRSSTGNEVPLSSFGRLTLNNTTLTADLRSFRLTNVLDAYEGGQRVFSRARSTEIPRDGL